MLVQSGAAASSLHPKGRMKIMGLVTFNLLIKRIILRNRGHQPVIRQIKLLKNLKNGRLAPDQKSCGVAFVEFREHQHALAAVRVLKNNPETLTSEYRPIVEFAPDNVQMLTKWNDQTERRGREQRRTRILWARM